MRAMAKAFADLWTPFIDLQKFWDTGFPPNQSRGGTWKNGRYFALERLVSRRTPNARSLRALYDLNLRATRAFFADAAGRTRRVTLKGHTCGGSPRPADTADCKGCIRKADKPVRAATIKLAKAHSPLCMDARGLSPDASRKCPACATRTVAKLSTAPYKGVEVHADSSLARKLREYSDRPRKVQAA